MKRWTGVLYYLIPLLHIAAVGGLFYLHFGYGEPFRQNYRSMSLRGAQPSGAGERPTRVRLEYGGLVFDFGRNRGPVLFYGDNRLPIVPLGYRAIDDGFEIELEQQTVLRFSIPHDAPDELHVQPLVGSQPRPHLLELPFRLTLGTKWAVDASRSLEISHTSGDYNLLPPVGGMVDPHSRLLTIRLDSSTLTTRYRPAQLTSSNLIEQWFSDDALAISDQEYAELLGAYFDVAYDGWAEGRYNVASGQWVVRDEGARFSEEILIAYLAEAWHRDGYSAAFNTMRRAADMHPDRVTLLSAPFLGNLDVLTDQIQSDRQVWAERLTEMVATGSGELFVLPDLLDLALSSGGSELHNAIVAAAAELDWAAASIPQAIGLLRGAIDSTHPSEESTQVFAQFRAVARGRIVPAIVRIDEGFFVRTGAGRIDIEQSLTAGHLLAKLGVAIGDRQLISIGRNLVASAVALADDSGYLPLALFIGSDELQGVDGFIAPERLYPLLIENPAYPHFTLSQPDDPIWMWSLAGDVELERRAGGYTIRLQNVPNRTHYIIVQGLSRPRSVGLFNRRWQDDPTFEEFASGYHYDRQTRILMIKYTDSRRNGRLEIEL